MPLAAMTPSLPGPLPRIARLVRVYLFYTVVLVCFYLLSPAISYLIFRGFFPELGLSTIHGLLLIPVFGVRLFLLLTGRLGIRTTYLALAYLLLIWISILQLLWFPSISNEVGSHLVFSNMALTLIGAWLLALGGEALAYLGVKNTRFLQRLLFATYLGLLFIIVDGVIRGFRLYERLLFAFQDPLSGQIYNYLGLADSLALVGLLLLSIPSKDTLHRGLGFYIVTSLLLLFAYSRSSFFIFLVVGLVLLTVKFWRRGKQQLLLTLLVGATVVLMTFVVWPFWAEVGQMFLDRSQLIFERFSSPFMGTDTSLQSRLDLLWKGLYILREHWLLGYYMGEVAEIGRGSYPHNWLSFWIAYGIGPFLLSVLLLLSLIVRNWHERKRGLLGLAGFGLLVFIFLSIVFSRSYIWPYFWFGLGFAGTCVSIKGEVNASRIPCSLE